MITMMSYIPFALHFYILRETGTGASPDTNTKAWMHFLVIHINLSVTVHTIAIYLCVLLSIVRYLHIRSPTRASSVRMRRITQSRYLILATYVISIITMIPNYLSNKLKQQEYPLDAGGGGGGGGLLGNYSNSSSINSNNSSIVNTVVVVPNATIYILDDLRLGMNDTDPLVLTNVWMYAITGKFVPCFLISVFGSLLLHQMRAKIKQRKDFLKVSAQNTTKLHEHSRTTKMLITVIVLFLITELPQGFLLILSLVKPGFFSDVYMPLGDIMDMVALINNSINFILYCSMSTKFRQTFLLLYCRPCRKYAGRSRWAGGGGGNHHYHHAGNGNGHAVVAGKSNKHNHIHNHHEDDSSDHYDENAL